MRTYKLTTAYDGTGYQGWQRQTGTPRTIQGILEKALTDAFGYPVEIDGSGRTDAGVHAEGQTASLVLPGLVDTDFFIEDVNRRLPADIRILRAELVKNGFHARKSAVGKAYEYRIDTGEKPDVFLRRFCYHFNGNPDVERIRSAAGMLKGTHDFAAFTDLKDDRSTKRTIYDIMITAQNSMLTIRYEGGGFMYHMVRILTGTLLEVGTGKILPEDIPGILESKERIRAGFLAPARGLCLKEVYYD